MQQVGFKEGENLSFAIDTNYAYLADFPRLFNLKLLRFEMDTPL